MKLRLSDRISADSRNTYSAMRILLASLAAALSLGILPAWGLGGPVPSVLATGCPAPTLEVTLDPDNSEAYVPELTLQTNGLALPASGRFDWGNGSFGIARLGGGAGRDALETTIRPVYESAGDYALLLQVTDACGALHKLDYTVTVPLALPSPARLRCPGSVDPNGICVVATGEEAALIIDGGPADASWSWQAPLGTMAQDTRSYRFSPASNSRHLIQATALSADGWIVTPPLPLVALPSQRPAITAYEDPRTVVAGESTQLGFTPPPGMTEASARIELDGRIVADSAATAVDLEPGDHVVRYIATADDGLQIQRQIVVIAEEDVPYLGLAGLAAAVMVTLTALLLLGRRGASLLAARRNRAPVPVALDERPYGMPRLAPTPRSRPAAPRVAAAGRPRTAPLGRSPLKPAFGGLLLGVGVVAIILFSASARRAAR